MSAVALVLAGSSPGASRNHSRTVGAVGVGPKGLLLELGDSEVTDL